MAGDGPASTFALGGLSKSCGLPQLKLAWTAVARPCGRCASEALGRLEVVADTYLSVSTPVQVAAPALLARREELQAPIARARRARTSRSCARASAATAGDAARAGGRLVRRPARAGDASEEERVLRLLETHDVLVHPGYFFDFPREAFLVAEPPAAAGRVRRGRASPRVARGRPCYNRAVRRFRHMPAKRVPPSRRASSIDGEGYVYLDVRSVPEFEAGHPRGAYNVPLLHMRAARRPSPTRVPAPSSAASQGRALVSAASRGPVGRPPPCSSIRWATCAPQSGSAVAV